MKAVQDLYSSKRLLQGSYGGDTNKQWLATAGRLVQPVREWNDDGAADLTRCRRMPVLHTLLDPEKTSTQRVWVFSRSHLLR